MRRTCTECGADFDARSSRALRCGDACRKRASRQRSRPQGSKPKASAKPMTEREAATLVGALTEELAERGMLDTVDGQAALVLANRIVSGHDTGTNVVSMIREMRALVDSMPAAKGDAPGGDPGERSPLDDLGKRRRQRAAV